MLIYSLLICLNYSYFPLKRACQLSDLQMCLFCSCRSFLKFGVRTGRRKSSWCSSQFQSFCYQKRKARLPAAVRENEPALTSKMFCPLLPISYPESSGFLVSGATPGRLWGHRKNSIFLIGCSVTVSIVLPQKSCGNKIRCPQSLPGVAPLTKKPEDFGYEIDFC